MEGGRFTKEQVAQAVITQIEEKDQKASIETALFNSYSAPEKVIWKSDKTGYVPDIKVVSGKGQVNIYEIEQDNEFNVNKWKLFSLYTKNKKGQLVLVVPEPRIEKVKDILTSKSILNVHLLYIPA